MSNTVLTKDITDLFGLDELSESERTTFLENVGELIIESTITRLMADMTDDEKKQFETFISKKAYSGDLLRELEAEYPRVTELFYEEMSAFKNEAVSVLGKGAG